MKIHIEYVLDWKTVFLDKEILSKSDLSFENIHENDSFSGFLDSFAFSKIIILEKANITNSIFVHGSILSFCYNFYKGLISLNKGEKEVAYSFGTEQGDYSFKYYLSNESLIIESRNVLYKYEFTLFLKVMETFIIKVIFELPFYYKGIEKSKYFTKFQKLVR